MPDEENGSGLNDGQWHFIAVTLEGDGTTTVWVGQGLGITEITGFTDYPSPVQPKWSDAALFSFGQEWDGAGASNLYDGYIDDVRIWNRKLSQSQIESLYLTIIPEPSTLLLLGAGVLCLVAWRVRRRRTEL